MNFNAKEIGFDLATALFHLNQGMAEYQVATQMEISTELLRQTLKNLGDWKVRSEAVNKYEIGTVFMERDGPYVVFDRHERFLSINMNHVSYNYFLRKMSSDEYDVHCVINS